MTRSAFERIPLSPDVQKTYRLSVSREGFVVIPDVGQINVGGMTRAQLDDALYARLGQVYSGVRRNGGIARGQRAGSYRRARLVNTHDVLLLSCRPK